MNGACHLATSAQFQNWALFSVK
uniref:Uncharacterized protein n=1 Tax=Anguilla anguilla TaxID=7936 RepID=A0A0E9UV29_ANGAN